MADENQAAIQAAQQQPPTLGASPAVASATGKRSAYKDLKVELTIQDLANPGTQKLLLHNYFTAEDICDELKSELKRITPLHTEADKQVGILTEKLASYKSNDFLFTAMVALGGAVMGAAPAFHEISGFLTFLVFVVGLAIMCAVIYSKRMLK